MSIFLFGKIGKKGLGKWSDKYLTALFGSYMMMRSVTITPYIHYLNEYELWCDVYTHNFGDLYNWAFIIGITSWIFLYFFLCYLICGRKEDEEESDLTTTLLSGDDDSDNTGSDKEENDGEEVNSDILNESD